MNEDRGRFADALACFDVSERNRSELIQAAAKLVAAGEVNDAVLELACFPAHGFVNPFVFEAAVDAAREALRMPRLRPEAAQVRAVQGQVARWRRGDLTDRELAHWTRVVLGYDSVPRLICRLALLDEDVSGSERTRHDKRAQLERIAAELEAFPDPWAEPSAPPRSIATWAPLDRAARSLRRRFRRSGRRR